MNDDVEAKVLEAQGPVVLVVMPNWIYARQLGENLRAQYKDMATGTRERIFVRGGKQIHIISGRTQQMRGRRCDDLIIHPQVHDLPNIGDIIASCQACVSEGGTWHQDVWE